MVIKLAVLKSYFWSSHLQNLIQKYNDDEQHPTETESRLLDTVQVSL